MLREAVLIQIRCTGLLREMNIWKLTLEEQRIIDY